MFKSLTEFLLILQLHYPKLVENEENHWLIDHGFLEHKADSTEYISKHDMAVMIRSGEMNLLEENSSETLILEESLTLESNNDFEDFIKSVDRYLLINENKESSDFEYNWQNAWSEGKNPIETAEEAILLEG